MVKKRISDSSVSDSFFALAQILIIISGFMFTSSGIAYGLKYDLQGLQYSYRMQLIEDAEESSTEKNITIKKTESELGNGIEEASTKERCYFRAGVILALFSIISCIVGFMFIKKKK